VALIVISTSVEKPLTDGVVPVSDSRTKSDVLVVNDEGKVKLAEKTVFELKKNIKKRYTRLNLSLIIFIKK
tara:strand:+ start:354 stop:566 length:213 start_codon:yes stop_codon:yes gene_type:complete